MSRPTKGRREAGPLSLDASRNPSDASDVAAGGRWLFRTLIALVLLAPIPLGCVYPLASALLAAATAALLLWSGLASLLRRRRESSGFPNARPALWPIAAPFLAAALWAAVQASPSTPVAWHHPLWEQAADALGAALPGAVSIDPFETLSALMRLLSYGGVFWLSWRLCRTPGRGETALLAMAAAGGIYAAYALFNVFSGIDLVLWYPKTVYSGMASGTFFNRNTYATYAGLGLVCVSALTARAFLAHASGAAAAPGARRLRWWLLPAWMLLATALLLSASRGGLISATAGLVAAVTAFSASPATSRRSRAVAAALLLVLAIAFAAFSGGRVAERLASTEAAAEDRPIVWALTTNEIARRLWVGVGYGAFEEAFHALRPAQLGGYFDKAHNTYLEDAMELGVPAAAALTFAAAVAAIGCVVGLRRAPDVSGDALGRAAAAAAGLGASTLVAVHSVVDFSLQIPAVAIAYAFILGAALAWATPLRRGLPPRGLPPFPAQIVAVVAPIAFAVTVLVLALPRIAAETLLLPGNHVLRAIEDGRASGPRDLRILAASREHSLSWADAARVHADLALAKLLLEESSQGTSNGVRITEATRNLEASLALAPADPYAWTRLAYGEILAGAPARRVLPLLRMAVRTGPFERDLVLPRLRLLLIEAPYFTPEDAPLLEAQVRFAWSQAHDDLVRTAFSSGRSDVVSLALAEPDREEFGRLETAVAAPSADHR
jgi:O-antigen ligase